MMKRIKRLTAMLMSILILSSVFVFGSTLSASAKGTGTGLAEWALNAYYSGWSYVYGGATPGAVDCSGLIYSYCGGERCGNPQLNTATARGNVSNGIPNIHGLGLWRPGHVGVYVGNNMEVDARGDDYGVCYQAIGGYNNWTYWFKLAACSYPTTGWEKFNGEYYYYENGEYITNTSRTIGGTTYYFNSKGVSSKTPSNTSATASNGSSSSSSSSKKPTSWKNGSTGEEVKKIQSRLKELGYYNGAVDGDFGDMTEQAFKAFQRQAGLYVDGIAGSDRNVLYASNAPKAPAKEEKATQPATEAATQAPTEPASNSESEAATEPAAKDDGVYQNGDESDKVTEIQEKLAELLYFNIEPTGYFGEYTEQIVKNFQLENSLEATGIVDEETYAVLFGDSAVKNPSPESEAESQAPEQVVTGPLPINAAGSSTSAVYSDSQEYASSAAEVAGKTNSGSEKALSNSASVIPAATTAQVRRTANIWLWFVLVAIILGALATVFLLRDRKATRYTKYVAKKKGAFKAEASSRW